MTNIDKNKILTCYFNDKYWQGESWQCPSMALQTYTEKLVLCINRTPRTTNCQVHLFTSLIVKTKLGMFQVSLCILGYY